MSDIDNLITMLTDNWTGSIVPTFADITTLKRTNYQNASYVLLYELNHNEKKRGFRYDFAEKVVTYSIDIRTKLSYQDLKLLEAEVLRIFHLKRLSPISGYETLKVIRRTDLSEKMIKIYHTVIDIEIKKYYTKL